MTAPLGLRQVLGWWSWRPWVLLGLTAASATYARGVARLWANAGAGHGIRRLSVAAYGAGMASLVVALMSPLDPLAALLFSAHMSQHELLMLVAAPLIVMGHPIVALLWAVPPPVRERLLRAGKQPATHGVWRRRRRTRSSRWSCTRSCCGRGTCRTCSKRPCATSRCTPFNI